MDKNCACKEEEEGEGEKETGEDERIPIRGV